MPESPRIAKTKEKIDSLESVRGLAALIVVNYHLVLGFYPALWNDNENQFSLLWKILWNGPLAVNLFFVLSGFVLSMSFLKSGNIEQLRSAACRRYFRLAIPAAASVIISYLILKSGFYQNQIAANFMNQADGSWLGKFNNFEPKLFSAIREGFWGAFTESFSENSYNHVLWTMRREFIGSLFIYSFLALTGQFRYRPALYFIIGFVLLRTNQEPLLLFLIGCGLCEFSLTERFESATTKHRSFIGCAFLILVSLPVSAITPQWFLEKFGHELVGFENYKYLPACLILFGVIGSSKMRRLFENRLFLFFGKISFSLYLAHVLVEFSIGSFVYLKFARDLGYSHFTAYCFTALTTFGISIFAGWIGSKTLDPFSIYCGRQVYERWFKPKSAI